MKTAVRTAAPSEPIIPRIMHPWDGTGFPPFADRNTGICRVMFTSQRTDLVTLEYPFVSYFTEPSRYFATPT